MRRAVLAAAGLAVCACGARTADERDQWTVVITTDAPLPQFGDRLLLEVLDASGGPACAGCRRQIGVPSAWPVSFGVVPPERGTHLRVRVRLYRTRMAGADGLPGSAALIDATGALDRPTGNTNVHLHLAMACFGVPPDLAAATTCDPATGLLAPEPRLVAPRGPLSDPGTWEGARDVSCAAEPPDDTACVPGATFLLGSPASFATGASTAQRPERVVRVSPFALDRDEMSVGAVRQLVRAGALAGTPMLHSSDANDLFGMCTWLGPEDATNDAMPVNCVSHVFAQSVCAELGKRLPTEAEFEFAAGNRRRESTYPWGESDDFCHRMIAGRGRIAGTLSIAGEVSACRAGEGEVLPAGPVAGGSDADVTLDPAGIRNLGGNVAEWVEDAFAPYSGEYWSSAPLDDPLCDVADPGETPIVDPRSIRGGSWAGQPITARASWRNAARRASFDPYLGFRCAKDL